MLRKVNLMIYYAMDLYQHAALLDAHIHVAISTVKAQHLFTIPESPLKPLYCQVISPSHCLHPHICFLLFGILFKRDYF